jgi:glutaredoxin 3
VDYLERDVTRDPEARETLVRMNAPGVPVIVIDHQAVFGFDRIRLDDLLKAHQPGPLPAAKPL